MSQAAEQSASSRPVGKITARLLSSNFKEQGAPTEVECRIEVHDSALLGRQATYTLSRVAKVNRTGGHTTSDELFRWTGRLNDSPIVVPVPAEALAEAYLHVGRHTTLRVESQIVVDDGVFYDTTAVDQVGRPLPERHGGTPDGDSLVNPHDAYNFYKNFKALPFHRKVTVAVLTVVALAVAGVNTFIGWHDQTSPAAQTWIYSHKGSKGKSKSPLFDSLVLSGGTGAVLVAAILAQLRGYMSFGLKSPTLDVTPDLRLPIAELIAGLARVPLENVTLRVVAANFECGSYTVEKRSKGKTRRETKTFREPTRGVVLYEQTVAHIAANQPVEGAFTGEVDFAPLFAALHPPLLVNGAQGIDVGWEVQLLVPDLVDQEIVGPAIGAPASAYRRPRDSAPQSSDVEPATAPPLATSFADFS